ncbi:uncharacterized protein Z518_03577 [Rhinocladiella mackenziei CBS 650.93]|uniref:Rhinocladiella mackenziei CBS 650.93 unplaced genomic scaffold supercont1.2, whole genome shotgun sequence n=1 Tax=Rhinocladiella mackenziei CBS 650.93 TaxID=1442369 RepID=A0A0D2JHV8_9EURO|nr:uncharacterized protein Z518_03577 [Rhinocladiella mackenziei CBS 650.93]KIX08920.1 hypothetical protein Z518_03577 [Rhinocladiella mackenziei CBS 650.93]
MLAVELRRHLPTHDEVFAASTRVIWMERMSQVADLTNPQYPLIFWHFLRDGPSKVTINLSITGSFIVLHEILVSFERAVGSPSTRASVRARVLTKLLGKAVAAQSHLADLLHMDREDDDQDWAASCTGDDRASTASEQHKTLEVGRDNEADDEEA